MNNMNADSATVDSRAAWIVAGASLAPDDRLRRAVARGGRTQADRRGVRHRSRRARCRPGVGADRHGLRRHRGGMAVRPARHPPDRAVRCGNDRRRPRPLRLRRADAPLCGTRSADRPVRRLLHILAGRDLCQPLVRSQPRHRRGHDLVGSIAVGGCVADPVPDLHHRVRLAQDHAGVWAVSSALRSWRWLRSSCVLRPKRGGLRVPAEPIRKRVRRFLDFRRTWP